MMIMIMPRSLLLPNVTLPLGDINVVVVTDVHSWVAGHARHEPTLDADYGDVLSFYLMLQALVEDDGQAAPRDLFFVMNGDFVDGTGLSSVPPEFLTPILQRMPWDAVNMGNHELYHNGEFSTSMAA
jgi:2',3'-cyclic-nucleotide 2'-phosphodiesterase (5'-nucleotidase family)